MFYVIMNNNQNQIENHLQDNELRTMQDRYHFLLYLFR
jgi:hypothetical protein